MSTEKRKGRPLTGIEPLTHDIKARISEKDFQALTEYSKKENITFAESIRRGISLLLKKK